MRLDKFLSDAAALTRSEARKAIKNGEVTLGGKVLKDIAYQINEDDPVFLRGEKTEYKKNIYIMLNKPRGVVSATEDKNKETVLSLLPPEYARYNLFPAGRLDIDTVGFLLLTNDGKLTHNLLAPNKKVGKTYFVRLEQPLSKEDVHRLENGVDIGECVTKKAIVELCGENEMRLTITEGKFHQIKRMAKAVGNNVLFLKRLSYGPLFLDEALKEGEYRHLTEAEKALLCNVYKKNV